MRRATAFIRALIPYSLVAALLAGIALTQLFADRYRPVVPATTTLPRVSAATIRLIDLGLHLPIASLMWIDKRLDVLTLSDTNRSFLDTVTLINGIDPQFSTPYAFSTLVMPNQRRCSYCRAEALEIGKRGIAQAEPDWRIPFYMAVEYFTELKDKKQAAYYFDIAARTPGAPPNIKTFSLNYSTAVNERSESRRIWRALAQATSDKETRARAEKYLERLDLFDLLDQSVSVYRRRFGMYPKDLQSLVTARIIPFVPADPFGYTLELKDDGRIGFKVEQ